MACSGRNRFQLPGSPSTCALDESITPLPSIFLFIFVVLFILYTLILRFRNPTRPQPSHDYTSPGLPIDSKSRTTGVSSHIPFAPPLISEGVLGPSFWKRAEKIIHYAYIGLTACLLGMRILEVIRLNAAEMGVGLLPFGIVMSIFILFAISTGERLGFGRSRGIVFSSTLLAYWSLSVILESVKVGRLTTYNEVHPADGTKYPSSDWLLDNGVMLALLIIFFLIEGAYLTSLIRYNIFASVHASQKNSVNAEDTEGQWVAAPSQSAHTFQSVPPKYVPEPLPYHPYRSMANTIGHARTLSSSSLGAASTNQARPASPRSWTSTNKNGQRIDKSAIGKPEFIMSSLSLE